MGHLSPAVIELFNRVRHYLVSQKQSPELAMAQEQPLFDHINALTHQDLMTPVAPSGENLLAHFILLLHEDDAFTPHGFIFTTLINRSLFFRFNARHLPDATTFLLTSSNANNRTPFQLVDSFKNKYLLDYYLTQVRCHLSEPFMGFTHAMRYCAQDVFEADVLANKSTPWNCPLELSFLFLGAPSASGFRLLDKLVQPYSATEQFTAALDVLRAALIGRHIPIDLYKHALLTHPKLQYSLLHELIMAGNVNKLKAYLSAVDVMHQEHLMNADEYKGIFYALNTAGYSVMHQAVNAPNVEIAHNFLSFMNHRCSLPLSQRREMFEFRSRNTKAIFPHRDPSRYYQTAQTINDEIRRLSDVWQLEEVQYLHNNTQSFFAGPPVTEVTVSPRLGSLVSALVIETKTEAESEANDTGGWSPWNSPVSWSLSNSS